MATSRQVLELVLAQRGITQEEIAAELGVSARTVRSYVGRLNDSLADVARIELQRGAGYSLSVMDEPGFARFRSRLQGQEHDTGAVSKRVAYMLEDLLTRSDWVKLGEYAEALFVSRQMLSRDLATVEKVLNRFDLVLERRPHYGMRVVGSEVQRRICLTGAVVGRVTPGNGPVGAADDASRVWSIIDDACSVWGLQLSSDTLQNLVTHLLVAIVRMREGCYVPVDLGDLLCDAPAEVRDAAAFIAQRIGEEFSLYVPSEEAAYITVHLMGKISADGVPFSEEFEAEALAISGKMLDVVSHAYHINLREDIELRATLALHLAPLIVRLRYRMNQSNPMLEDIRHEFPLAFSIAADASMVLFARFGVMPSADEVGYLALLFELALERKRKAVQEQKMSIVIACASGMGSARILEHRCRREFGDRIDRIVSCDVRHLSSIDYTDIDCVLSTVPIPFSASLSVPSIVIGSLFGPQDVKEVNDFLQGIGSGLDSYFREELFFPSCRFDSKWEAIHVLCEKMVRFGADSSLEELVLRRERSFTTAVGNGVAIPHPVDPTSEQMFLSIALLDEPLIWDDFGHEVCIVFLISFPNSDSVELDSFFHEFSALIANKELVDALALSHDWDSFMRRMTLSGSGSCGGG